MIISIFLGNVVVVIITMLDKWDYCCIGEVLGWRRGRFTSYKWMINYIQTHWHSLIINKTGRNKQLYCNEGGMRHRSLLVKYHSDLSSYFIV